MRIQLKRAPYLALLSCLAISLCSVWCGACPPDFSGNAEVDVDDLLVLIDAWGPCPAPPAVCPADISPVGGNGVVDVDDLVNLIDAWGPCPGLPTCDELSWQPIFGGIPGLGGGVYALTIFDDGSGSGPALYAGGEFKVAGGFA